MPCGDYSSDETIQEQSKRILALTRIACDLAAHVEYPSQLNKETRDWMASHAKVDRERLQREREEVEKAFQKKKALKKLTPEERRLLGI